MMVIVSLWSQRKLWCFCISFLKPSGSMICWQQRKEILPNLAGPTFSVIDFFWDEKKRESVMSEQHLQVTYNDRECSRHNRCWESSILDAQLFIPVPVVSEKQVISHWSFDKKKLGIFCYNMLLLWSSLLELHHHGKINSASGHG